MAERLVVIGGDAAGMSAAAQARRARTREQLTIVALERGRYTSYSACGIPYWIAGDVAAAEDLIARSPRQHSERGIDVRLRTEAVELDLDRRQVVARLLETGGTERVDFDQLVIATGAVPIRPPLPGVDARGVHWVHTVPDGHAVLASLAGLVGPDPGRPRRAVVVGGGYIGIEMAEAMHRRGLATTLVDRSAEPMGTLDPDMGARLRRAMVAMGIEVITGAGVEAVETESTPTGDRATGVRADRGMLPADLVVFGLGVRPNTGLARAAGLELGASGGIRTDQRMRVPGADGVWAGGDCVEVYNRISERFQHVALGTHANKHGRVIGTNLTGGDAVFPGVVGTAVSRVCDLEVARTGLREAEARQAGFDVASCVVEATTRSGYFPGSAAITVKLLADRPTGRLLGCQLLGGDGTAKRIDTVATALWTRLTVADLVSLDLAYAPPFGPVWDPVQLAARRLLDEGLGRSSVSDS